jgi:hypothetical protein
MDDLDEDEKTGQSRRRLKKSFGAHVKPHAASPAPLDQENLLPSVANVQQRASDAATKATSTADTPMPDEESSGSVEAEILTGPTTEEAGAESAGDEGVEEEGEEEGEVGEEEEPDEYRNWKEEIEEKEDLRWADVNPDDLSDDEERFAGSVQPACAACEYADVRNANSVAALTAHKRLAAKKRIKKGVSPGDDAEFALSDDDEDDEGDAEPEPEASGSGDDTKKKVRLIFSVLPAELRAVNLAIFVSHLADICGRRRRKRAARKRMERRARRRMQSPQSPRRSWNGPTRRCGSHRPYPTLWYAVRLVCLCVPMLSGATVQFRTARVPHWYCRLDSFGSAE